MDSIRIDINADVGEGIGNEKELMPFLSSCNIACGGHAGDKETMGHIVALAKLNRVKIGAHPSFPDRENFGRQIMDMSAADLYSSLKQQVRQLEHVLYKQQARLNHIKPHGALYNLAAINKKTAMVIVEVVKSLSLPVKLYVPFGSVIGELAKIENIPTVLEAFADRNYNKDLTLVSRQNKGALITDSKLVIKHMLLMIKSGKVETISGEEIDIMAQTFCVHGDTKTALEILKCLHSELPKNNIVIS